MDEEEKARLLEQVAGLQSRFDKQDADAAASQKAAQRQAMMDKFGGMFSNDDEIGDLVEIGLAERGSSVESATLEAVRELIIEPLAKKLNTMMGKIVKQIDQATEEVMEGPTEQLDINNPETLPEMVPPTGPMPGDMGAVPPTEGMAMSEPPPGAPGMAPPEGDLSGGAPPPPLPPGQEIPPAPPPMVSDERFKNVRSTVVSDERFKELGEISDIRLKALEKLSSFTELSDEDMKTVIFKELPKEEAFKDDLKPHAIKVSDEEKKDIEVSTEKGELPPHVTAMQLEGKGVDPIVAAALKQIQTPGHTAKELRLIQEALAKEGEIPLEAFDFSQLVKEPGIGEPELGEFDLKEIGRTLASLTPRRSV